MSSPQIVYPKLSCERLCSHGGILRPLAGRPALPRRQSHFRLGTDCVLLSDFTAIGGAKRGIDLGCASGAIMLLLLSRSNGCI